MWKISIEDDEGNRTVVSLVRDEYLIGRAEQNTVRLTERNISRVHAYLRRNGTAWQLDDATSYNGSFVNGTRVSTGYALKHGDLVQLGDYKLIVIDESQTVDTKSADGATLPVGPPNTSPLDQPDRLVMLVGPTPGVEFPLASARIIVGRGEDCDIGLNHSSVSRVHAEIQALQDGRYEIIDRGSANGVRVNGTELGRSLLDARDTIELGDVVLKFIPAGDSYRFESDDARRLGELAPSSVRSSSLGPASQRHVLSLPAKMGCGLSALAVAGVVASMAFGLHKRFLDRTPPVVREPASQTPQADAAGRTLKLAIAQLRRGQIVEAHATVAALPAGSNARQSRSFREIESAWADMMLARAAQEQDLERAREILDLVARSPSIDPERRKHAADEITRLDAQALDVAELPRSADPPPESLETSTESARTSRLAARQVRPRSGVETPKVASATAAGSTSESGDDRPATPPKTHQMVASGNLAQLTAAKDSLKAKVNAGVATQQERKLLRALCRQLGDRSCIQ